MLGEPGVVLMANLTRKDQATSIHRLRITINYAYTAVIMVYASWNKPECTTEEWRWWSRAIGCCFGGLARLTHGFSRKNQSCQTGERK